MIDDTLKIIRGNYIDVVGRDIYTSVMWMVMEHYNNVNYTGTLFIINFNVTALEVISKFDLHPTQVIYYDLEHLRHHKYYWFKFFEDENRGYDRIWTMSIDNYEEVLKHVRPDAEFRPLRYTIWNEQWKVNKKENPRFDLGITCLLDYDRRQVLADLSQLYMHNSSIIIWGQYYTTLKDILGDCKYALDLSHDSEQAADQNQLRISEMLSIGMPVISDRPMQNYFKGLVKICDRTAQGIISQIGDDWREDYADKYKQLTWSDEAYEKYRKELEEEYYTL